MYIPLLIHWWRYQTKILQKLLLSPTKWFQLCSEHTVFLRHASLFASACMRVCFLELIAKNLMSRFHHLKAYFHPETKEDKYFRQRQQYVSGDRWILGFPWSLNTYWHFQFIGLFKKSAMCVQRLRKRRRTMISAYSEWAFST